MNRLLYNRITGIDPAGPLFIPYITAFLTEDDAIFVDALHCDAGCYGTLAALATADFFANLGIRYQPGCNVTIPFSFLFDPSG